MARFQPVLGHKLFETSFNAFVDMETIFRRIGDPAEREHAVFRNFARCERKQAGQRLFPCHRIDRYSR